MEVRFRKTMKGQFTLFIQYPKPKNLGLGVLDIDKSGTALFFGGINSDELLATMKRVKIETAAMNGISISGFQPIGFEKTGIEKFRYQEWWLRYE